MKYLVYNVTTLNKIKEQIYCIENPCPDIYKIYLYLNSKEEQGYIDIKFELKDENINFKNAKEAVESKLDEIINKLVFIKGYYVGKPSLIDDNFDQGKHGSISYPIVIKFEEDVFTFQQLSEFESLVKGNDSVFYKLYKDAVSIKDRVGRFMFLYSLLFLILEVNTQKEIDNYILGKENCEMRQSTRRKPKDGSRSIELETVYTWLRNQIGHTQYDSGMREVIRRLAVCENKLRELVKIAIKEKVI